MRLIDADALIPKLKFICEGENQIYRRESWGFAIQCLNAVEDAPTINPQPRWIPCSERLPEEDHWLGGSGRQFSDNVLISILNSADEDEWVDASYTIDGEWTLELSKDCKVIAWMPLPSPYREEDDE